MSIQKPNDAGKLVRDMRKTLGLSQEALARELELSWKTISRYEGDQPPKSGGILRLVRFAEERGLDEFATKFRQAYLAEAGQAGVGRLMEAMEFLHKVHRKVDHLNSFPLRHEYEKRELSEIGILVYKCIRVLQEFIPSKEFGHTKEDNLWSSLPDNPLDELLDADDNPPPTEDDPLFQVDRSFMPVDPSKDKPE